MPPSEYTQLFSQLAILLDDVHQKGGLKRLSPQHVQTLAYKYLQASAIMAWLASQQKTLHQAPSPQLMQFQQLIVDAHSTLYPESDTTFHKLWHFLTRTLYQQLWVDRGYHLLALSSIVVTALIAFVLVRHNFELAPLFMSSMLRDPSEMDSYIYSSQARHLMLTGLNDINAAQKTFFAGFLMYNNIRVALICFVSGFIMCVPTFFLLIQTGLMLGTLPALFYPTDIVPLTAWLMPHGVPELSAIILASGAGLKIGHSMLNPQQVAQTPRISTALKQTILSQLGCVLVFVILLEWAGLVESFVRQSHLSDSIRLMIAAVSTLPIVGLFIRGYWVSRHAS